MINKCKNFNGLQRINRHNALLIRGLIFLLGFGTFIFKIILSICVFLQLNKTKLNELSSCNNNNNRPMTNTIPINLKSPDNLPISIINTNSINNGENPFKTPVKENKIFLTFN
jgi:hypothetical protein